MTTATKEFVVKLLTTLLAVALRLLSGGGSRQPARDPEK